MTGKFKKGQFGLERVMAYILYAVGALLMTAFVLALPSCLIDKQGFTGVIKADARLAAEVRADAQLNSYLRTEMPDKALLFERLDWLSGKKKEGYIFAGQFDDGIVDRVKKFVEAHPEAYTGKDYSGFISSLQALYILGNNDDKQRIKEAFKLVSAAMFFRSARDPSKKIGHELFVFPIAVDFDPKDLKPSRTDVSLCALEETYKEFELCETSMPWELNYAQFIQSVQAVPVRNGNLAKVEMRYYPEYGSWLPKP